MSLKVPPNALPTAVTILGVLGVVYIFATANFAWNEIPAYLVSPLIISGVKVTVLLTIVSMAIGIAIGVILALMQVSPSPFLRRIAMGYIWIFRGIPLLVQIIFWFNLALFIPRLGFGQFSISTNDVMGSITAALIALSLNEGAYMAEIVRGGILSVNSGEIEAARALGMSRRRTFRRIVLPQAMRIAVPSTGNQLIGMLKATSLVSVIGVHDLLTQAQYIYTSNYLIMELLIVASVWYLVLTALGSGLQHLLEKKISHRPADLPEAEAPIPSISTNAATERPA